MENRSVNSFVLRKYAKPTIVVVTIVFYILAFNLGRPYFGNMMGGIFMLLPVIFVAWFYGVRITLVFSVVITLAHFLVVYFLFQGKTGDVYIQSLIGASGIIFVGYMVGRSRDISKKISQLQESAIALKLGIERAKDIVFVTDTEGKIIYTNPSFEKTYGYSRGDWEGKTPRILKSGKTPIGVYKELWDKLKMNTSFDYTLINRTKDGRYLSIESTTSSVLDESGKLIGYLAIQKDVTNQKQTEESLVAKTEELERAKNELENRQKELEDLLQGQRQLQEELKKERDTVNLIIGSMGEGLLMIGSGYKIKMINSKALYLLGVSEEEVIGKVWADVVKAYKGTDLIPFKERTSMRVLKTGASLVTTLDDDHYYLTPSGKRFPVTSVTTPVITNDEITGVVKVFKDASTEKEAKRIIEETVKTKTVQLKREQQISSSILENAGEGVVLSDNKGKVTYVNPAFIKMMGITAGDILDKEFPDAVSSFDLKGKEIKPEDISDAAAVTATKHEMKIQIATKTSGKIAVLVNAAPVYVEENYVGVVRVIHDVTEELRLQQQKDDFFSIASHELRTPLTVISGNLDTLMTYSESDFSQQDKEIIGDTIASSDRLIKLISDYLNVSRLDQGRLKYEISEVDACEVTQSVVNELKSLTDEKGLELTYECQKDQGKVLADEGLLKEILINLIGNAVKFTDKGSITVVHTKEEDKLKISVTDTGEGIAENMQDKLFKRFQQVNTRTLTRRAGGTGLGLYISREFVKVMKGDLVLEKSEPGQGSTFSFTLPLVAQQV